MHCTYVIMCQHTCTPVYACMYVFNAQFMLMHIDVQLDNPV